MSGLLERKDSLKEELTDCQEKLEQWKSKYRSAPYFVVLSALFLQAYVIDIFLTVLSLPKLWPLVQKHAPSPSLQQVEGPVGGEGWGAGWTGGEHGQTAGELLTARGRSG